MLAVRFSKKSFDKVTAYLTVLAKYNFSFLCLKLTGIKNLKPFIIR